MGQFSLSFCTSFVTAYKYGSSSASENLQIMFKSMQKNKLGHKVSTREKKTINKMGSPGSRYGQKRDGLVCAKPNRHVCSYISGFGGRF